jgi:hypothetical protein
MAFETTPPGFRGFELDGSNIRAIKALHEGLMLVVIDHRAVLIPILPLESVTDECIAEIKDLAAQEGDERFQQMISCGIADAVQKIAKCRTKKKAAPLHQTAIKYALMYTVVTGNHFAMVEHNSKTMQTYIGALPVRDAAELQAWIDARVTSEKASFRVPGVH